MNKKFLAACALVLVSAALLGGCNNHKPAGPRYDLSAESNRKFLSDNAAHKGVVTTASGLQYLVVKSGHGAKVASPADVVSVTYKGWTIDGHVFDQTEGGQTATFSAGGVIGGWIEALKLMREGDEWQVVIPSQLGYGADGSGADIPPDQTLVFNMKLVSVAPAGQ